MINFRNALMSSLASSSEPKTSPSKPCLLHFLLIDVGQGSLGTKEAKENLLENVREAMKEFFHWRALLTSKEGPFYKEDLISIVVYDASNVEVSRDHEEISNRISNAHSDVITRL